MKHVSNEELANIPGAADDLFIIDGTDAFEKRQLQQQQQQQEVRRRRVRIVVCSLAERCGSFLRGN